MILGDLNSDLCIANNNKLIEIMMLFNLANMISKPTRITAHSNTLLDPIIISDIMKYIYSDVLEIPSEIIDHDASVAFFYIVQRVLLVHSNGKSGYMIKLINKQLLKNLK